MLSWVVLIYLTTIVQAQNWTVTGSLTYSRDSHTATLLLNGNVLVAGGQDVNGNQMNSAELYNATNGLWTVTSNLTYARYAHTATQLPNGNVLVAGGFDGDRLNSAELYNATTCLWTVTGNLTYARFYHTAILLLNGDVLVAGGTAYSAAELYNATTGLWTVTGSLKYARRKQTATLLPNGNVLVAGGDNNYPKKYLNIAEVYNVTTGVWTVTGSLKYARSLHTAILLLNGDVLVAGGFNNDSALNSAELYNPTTGLWTLSGSLTYARDQHTATLLPNGNVLVAGGNGYAGYLYSAEVYNATTGVWTVTGNLTYARKEHTATLLLNGNVLVSGGFNGRFLNSAELYTSTTVTQTPTSTPKATAITPTPTLALTSTSSSTRTPTPTATRTSTSVPSPTSTSTPTRTSTSTSTSTSATATTTPTVISTSTFSATSTSTSTATTSFAATPTSTPILSSPVVLVCPSLQSNSTTGFGSFNVTSANTTAIGFCSAGFTGSPSIFCNVNGNWNFTSLLNPCAKAQVAVIDIPTFSPSVVINLSYVATGSVSFSNGSLYLGSGASSIGSLYFNQTLIPAITSIPQDLTFSVMFGVSTDCNPCSGGIAFVVQKSASLSFLNVNFPFFSSSTAVTNPYVAVVVNVGTQKLGVYSTANSTFPEFFIPFQATGSSIVVWVDYLFDQELPVLQISLNSTGSGKPLQPGISNIFNLTSVDNLGTGALPIYQGFFGFAGNSIQTNRIVSVHSSAPQSCPAIASDPSLGIPSFPSTATDSVAEGVCPIGWQGQPERLCNAQGIWVPFLTTDYGCSLISPTSPMCSTIQGSDNGGHCQAGSIGSPTLQSNVDDSWSFNSLFGSSSNGAIAGGIIGLFGLVLFVLWQFISRFWNKKATKEKENKSLDNGGSSQPMSECASVDMPMQPSEQMTNQDSVDRTGSATGSSPIQSKSGKNDVLIPFSSLKLGAVLGQGNFGQVFQATYRGAQVAVKKLKDVDKGQIMEEAKMMKSIPLHPNVLHYYGVSEHDGEIMMVTELCDKGNLALYLRNSNNTLTLIQNRQLCCQIASGMWHISAFGIVHRDLRAENVLLQLRGTEIQAKVADFGLARSLKSHDNILDLAYYRMAAAKEIPISCTAPEVLNPTDRFKYVAASDVWSFGVVMWEIYSRGAKPFKGTPVHAVIAMIGDPIRNVSLLPRPNNCPDDIFTIINSCWAFNPQDRPTFEQLYNQLS